MGDVQLNHTLLSVAASLTACFGSPGSAVEPVESPMALPVPELIATAFAKESLRGAAPAGDDLAPNDATVSTSAATTSATASLDTGAREERGDMGGSFRTVRARRSGTPLTVRPMDPSGLEQSLLSRPRPCPPVATSRGGARPLRGRGGDRRDRPPPRRSRPTCTWRRARRDGGRRTPRALR